MARTAIPVTTIVREGVVPPAQTSSDHANGMSIDPGNSNSVFVEVDNTDSASRNIGFALAQATIDGVAVPDKTIAVAAGVTKLMGPFTRDLYLQPDGLIYVNPAVDTVLKLRVYTT